MVAFDHIISAYEEALDAVAEAADPVWYDPGYDVEFREDLDGVFQQDRDVNNLSVIAQAVRAGMPVIGWHPARRNAGEEERVLRAGRQFTLAAKRLMSDFKAGTISAEQMQAGLSAAFIRQARNSFIAGKRALGNLQGLTAADDYDIAVAARQAGLGDRPDPRGLGAVLSSAMAQSGGQPLPDDLTKRIEGYVGDLIDRSMKTGFSRAVAARADERERERATTDEAVRQATAAASASRLDPDADEQAKRLADTKALAKRLRAEQTDAARRDRASRTALAAAIQAQITKAHGKLRARLSALLRAVLDGRISPSDAAAQLQALIRDVARRANLDGRRLGGGPPPSTGTTPEDDDAMADDEGGAGEDFLADLPQPPPGLTLGALFYMMFLDPTNLIDPDVARFFDRKLRGISDRFYSISKMGEKAAFRIGVQAPAISQIEAPPKVLARDWIDQKPTTNTVENPTALGQTVLVWWMLGVAAEHCPDCLSLADGGPYSLDVFNQLGIFPGSGHTQCEVNCRCSLSYDVASTVCGDGMADQFWESDIESVFVREAGACRLPIEVDALASGSTLAIDDTQVPDSHAFDWDADIAQSITFGRPGVGIPQKASWLLDTPPGEARYIKAPGTDGAGPVLTQRFELDGASYVAVFQQDAQAVRYITGYVDSGPAIYHHEFTVASLRTLSAMASEQGLRLDFDPRLINPGLRSFLRDIGATPVGPPPGLVQRIPDARVPGLYPTVGVPAGSRAPIGGPATDYVIPVMPAWQRPVPLAHTWNEKAVIQVGFRASEDRRESLKRLRDLLTFKRPVPQAFTTQQIDSIVARAEVFRAIGLDTSLGTGFRTMDDAGLAGEALRDGTIRLKPTAGLAGQVTAADSFGDLWAHEYGHLVAERLRATEPGFDAKMLDWATRNHGITEYAASDTGEAFAELFAILTRPDYLVGRIDGDVEVWDVLRRAGLWQERVRLAPVPDILPVFPDIPNLIQDGRLLPGWTDLGQRAADRLGGTTKRTLLRDPQGIEWLFKPDGAEAEIAGSAMVRLFGLNAPPVARVQYGTEWGSVQALIGAKATSFSRIPIESTSAYEARELFGHQLVDYMIGNWDAHAGNFLRDEAGRVWAVDKAFAFLSTPGTPLGSQQALWDVMFQDGSPRFGATVSRLFSQDPMAVAYGGGVPFVRMVGPDEIAEVLARFDTISDDSFRTVARMGADSEQGIVEMARRKAALRSEVEDLFGRLYDDLGANLSVFPADSAWHDWAKTRHFKAPKLGMADEVTPPLRLAAPDILKPNESLFFKTHSPAQVRDAVLALPTAQQRLEAETLIRNVVTMWKKDVQVIPTDWQVWSVRGGTFTAPSMATPPGPVLGVGAKQYGSWGDLPPAPALKPGPKTEPHWWQSQYTSAGPAPEKVPQAPWQGDQWVIPKDGPIDEAEVVIKGSDVPLNAPLQEWSGTIPDQPALPEGATIDWQRDELRKRSDAAWHNWQDVKDGKVDYAIAFGKAESDAAVKAGLLSERVGQTWYITKGKKAAKALRAAIDSGIDTNSDWFWKEWLGYSQSRLDAIDAYDAARKAKGLRAGVVIVEDDGRVWFQAPRNAYAGYENTWSKGGIDPGETPAAAAVREAREELGISVELDGYLGDFVSTDGGSITRYFVAHRTGGGPRFAARKETYAIRLGTPEQVRPVMLRYGKLDKRDTEVLDSFLVHQGLPPVAPLTPERGVLGRSIDDVDQVRSADAGLPSQMGYDPDEVIAMANLYAPSDVPGGGKVWQASTPWGNSESIYVDGYGWTKLTLKSLSGNYDVSAMKMTTGNFLAVAKAHGQNGLKVTVGGAWLDHIKPAFDAVGATKGMMPVPPGIVVSGDSVFGYDLTADQVTAMVKSLEDGHVLPTTPTVAVPAGSTGALASTLSPPDPLGPNPTALAHTGSFSAAPGAPAAAPMSGTFGFHKAVIDDVGKRFVAESSPGQMGPSRFIYKATTSLNAAQAVVFNRSADRLLVGTQNWLSGVLPPAKSAYMLDAVARLAEQVIDPSTSVNRILILKAEAAGAGLDELLTAFNMAQTPSFWVLEEGTDLAALRQAILTNALPDWISRVPSAPLAHGAQASAVTPSVAHTVTAAVLPTPAPVTTQAVPPFATKYEVDASDLHDLLAPGSSAYEDMTVGALATATHPNVHTFPMHGGSTVEVEWHVTANGNLRMVGFINTGTHDQGAAAALAWLHDMSVHMKSLDLGKSEHLAVTFTDDAWASLPPKLRKMLDDSGAHQGSYGGMVLGRKSTMDLVTSVDSEMATFVPASAVTAPVPSPVTSPIPAPPAPPAPAVGLAAKIGYDKAMLSAPGTGYGLHGTSLKFATPTQNKTVISEVATAGSVAMLQSKLVYTQAAETWIIPIASNAARDAYVSTLAHLQGAFEDILVAPTGGWTYMVPEMVVHAHPSVGDFLKQCGASTASDGSLFFKDDVAKNISAHLMNDTLPIPTAAIPPAVVSTALPGTLNEPALTPFWSSFGAVVDQPKHSPAGAMGAWLYEWDVVMDGDHLAVGALVEHPPALSGQAIIKSVYGDDTPAREAAFVGAVIQSWSPGDPLYVTEEVANSLGPQMFQAGWVGATLEQTTAGMLWRLDADLAQDLKDAYRTGLSLMPAVVPSSAVIGVGLPTSKTVLGSASISQGDALMLAASPGKINKATSVTGPLGAENWRWPLPGGGVAVAYVETGPGFTVIKDIAHPGSMGSWEVLAALMAAPPGNLTISGPLVSQLPDGFIQTLAAVSPTGIVTVPSGAMSIGPGSLDAIKTQLDLEFLTAKPLVQTVPPPAPVGSFAGATVAQPLTGGTMPVAMKVDLGTGFDYVKVSTYSLKEEVTQAHYPGLTGQNTTVKVASYGVGMDQVQVTWRRLGNGLEIHSAQTEGFVAHLRRMDEMLKANPKLTGVTIKPGALSTAGPQLRAYLNTYVAGIGDTGGKLSPAFVASIVDDLNADVLAAQAVPSPAGTLSPLGAVPNYSPTTALTAVPFSEPTVEAAFLTGTNTTVKMATYGAAVPNGTTISWRRLGNHLQAFHITVGSSTVAEANNHILAHINRMASVMDTSPKVNGMTFLFPDELPQQVQDALKAMGASVKGGRLTMTRQQVLDVRSALKADESLPAAVAPPPPLSALDKTLHYEPKTIVGLQSATHNLPNSPLLSGKNTTMKVSEWFQGAPGTNQVMHGTVHWRRLGNRLEIWAGDLPNPDVLMAHLKYMAEQFDASPKLDGLVFKTPIGNAQMASILVDDFGATYGADSMLRMTPTQVKAVRDALLSDAGMPGVGAVPSPYIAVPPPVTVPPAAIPKLSGNVTVTVTWPGKGIKMATSPAGGLAGAADNWVLLSTVPSLTKDQTKGLFMALLKKNPGKGIAFDGTDLSYTFIDQAVDLKALAPAPAGTYAPMLVLDPAAMQQYIGGAVPAPAVVLPPPTHALPKLVDDPTWTKAISTPPTVVNKYSPKAKFSKGKHGFVADMHFSSGWQGTLGMSYPWDWSQAAPKVKWATLHHMAQAVADGSLMTGGYAKTATQLSFSVQDIQKAGVPELAGFAAKLGIDATPTYVGSATLAYVFNQAQAKELADLIASNVAPRLPSQPLLATAAHLEMTDMASQAAVTTLPGGQSFLFPSGVKAIHQIGGLETYLHLASTPGISLTTVEKTQHLLASMKVALPSAKSANASMTLNVAGLSDLHDKLIALGASPGTTTDTVTIPVAGLASLEKALTSNQVPFVPHMPPAPGLPPHLVFGGASHVSATVTPTVTPPVVAAVPSGAPWKPPPLPPKPPVPATVWVPPSTTASSAHQAATNQVVIPDAKSISKTQGYDRVEVKQFLALGASDVDLGQVTANLIPQDAQGARWVTSGSADAVEARFATRPGFTTLAFTDMLPAPGVPQVQQEAAFWASLERFARDQADRVDESGNAVAKADLYITDNIYQSRPELRQMLLDLGGNQYSGAGTGDALVVTNITTGLKVGEAGETIKGRDFWRAYGDGIRLDKTQAKALADALDADTLDVALQGQVLAAAPPPPVLKVIPTGAKDNQPIRYLGVHPDHLYLAGNEVIGADGLRAVSTWAGGDVKATWLRTPNVLEWRAIEVVGTPSDATVRASTARQLYTMLEDLGQKPGMVLDVYSEAYDAMPDLRDLLLRYKGRQVSVGRDDFIRLNASEAGLLRIDLQAELGALKAPGSVKPIVDPIIWPAPQQLSQAPMLINGQPVKGQTRKAIFSDPSGNEWLFKPGASGRGTHADQAVHELSQLLGLRTPPVKEYSLLVNGKVERGTLQRLVPDLKHVKRIDELTPAQQDEVVQHSILDWLTANDDAHIENVMVGPDGHVWAIDKTRSWKGMGGRNDSLDPDLNGQGGAGLPPAINLWWRAVRRDPAVLASVSPKEIGRTLRYVESIDDETFLRVLGPVLDDWQQLPQFRSRQAFVDAVLKRKHGLKVDLETNFKREVGKVIAVNPSVVPKEWRDWQAAGSEFKLLTTPHEHIMEQLAEWDTRFGTYSPSQPRYLLDNPPPQIAVQVKHVLKETKRYSGQGIAGQGAAAYSGGAISTSSHGSQRYGAESIRIGNEEGFDYVTQVNAWAFLHQLFDPTVRVNSAIAELRASYNPNLGMFIMRRGVGDAGAPSTYIRARTQSGFRSVMGGSWGSGATRYKSGSPQMTIAIRPDQVFMSSAVADNAFNGGAGEAEIIFRDLQPEQVLHMDGGGHDWRSSLNLYYDYDDYSSPNRAELYKRLWAMYGGPQY